MDIAPPRSSLSEQIYGALRQALVAGVYEPGARLNIRKLALAHETSTTPVREAIMQLVREGALELQLGHQPRVPVLSVEQYIKIREVRAPLERLATELAAVHADPALIDLLTTLDQRFTAAEKDGRWKEAMDANQQFHFSIYRASGNDVLVRTIENLWLLTGPVINNQYPEVQHGHRDTDLHLLIIDALRRRVPNEAGDLVVQDMRQGSALIVQLLQSGGAARRTRARRPPAPA